MPKGRKPIAASKSLRKTAMNIMSGKGVKTRAEAMKIAKEHRSVAKKRATTAAKRKSTAKRNR